MSSHLSQCSGSDSLDPYQVRSFQPSILFASSCWSGISNRQLVGGVSGWVPLASLSPLESWLQGSLTPWLSRHLIAICCAFMCRCVVASLGGMIILSTWASAEKLSSIDSQSIIFCSNVATAPIITPILGFSEFVSRFSAFIRLRPCLTNLACAVGLGPRRGATPNLGFRPVDLGDGRTLGEQRLLVHSIWSEVDLVLSFWAPPFEHPSCTSAWLFHIAGQAQL